jgi:ribosome-binding factor A
MSSRIYKVNEKLRKEVSVLIRSEISSDAIITVTNVDTSIDLKKAVVWVSVFGGDEGDVFERIQDKRPEIQKIINKNMPSKHVPLLEFKPDHSAEYAQKIEDILKSEKNRR